MTTATSLLPSRTPDKVMIGEHFVRVRRGHGFSQQEFVLSLGIPETQVCKFEKGYICSDSVAIKLIGQLLQMIESTKAELRHHERVLAKFLNKTQKRVAEVADRRRTTAEGAEVSTLGT